MKNKIKKATEIICSLIIITLVTISSGCYLYREPSMVRNAETVSGDNLVYLVWDRNHDSNIDYYRIYRSLTPSGEYRLIAETHYCDYYDYGVYNGVTYFYAISAVSIHGTEGPLTDYLIYDTPRPEGYYANMADMDYHPEHAGWDFSAFHNCDMNSSSCDIYYDYYQGTGYLVCADNYTDIQDLGYCYSFDDVTYAPEHGWSPSGEEIVSCGHIYVIWTRDNHFAKIYIRDYDSYEIIFDWAYQLDPGNRELGISTGKIVSSHQR